MRIIKRLLQLSYTLLYSLINKKQKHVYLSINCRLNQHTNLEGYNKIGSSIISRSKIGRGTYIGNNCSLSNCKIGRYCSIGSNIKVLSATHPTSIYVSTHPAFFSTIGQAGFSYVNSNRFKESLFYDEKEKVVVEIGNDVWIGDDVTILGGCKIEDGSIIATGAVVTRNVPPYTIVGGVPAHVIKKRFSEEVITKLINFGWWNKSHEWLTSNSGKFEDIDVFISFIKENNN